MPNVQGFMKDPRSHTKLAVIYSQYPPAMDGWDWQVVEHFREQVDALFVPMNVRTVYRNTTSGRIVKFDRHVIALGNNHPLTYPHSELRRHPVLKPTMAHEHELTPHELLDILEVQVPGQKYTPVPGPFIPLQTKHVWQYKELAKWADDLLYETGRNYKDFRNVLADRRKAEYIKGRQEIFQKFKDESDYRWDHDWQWFMRQFARLTAQEKASIQREAGTARRFMKQAVGHSL
jgi:hypothetical protein